LHPTKLRIGIVLDNFSPHLSTKTDQRVVEWAAGRTTSNSLIRTYSSSLSRTEAQFQALLYFALDDADHASHRQPLKFRKNPPPSPRDSMIANREIQ
jgi:hypothetical protein